MQISALLIIVIARVHGLIVNLFCRFLLLVSVSARAKIIAVVLTLSKEDILVELLLRLISKWIFKLSLVGKRILLRRLSSDRASRLSLIKNRVSRLLSMLISNRVSRLLSLMSSKRI